MDDPRLPLDEELSPDGWRERVLNCFEILRVRQVPLSIETLEGVQMDGQIESLDGNRGRMVISVPRAPSAGLGADDEVQLFFTMRESRWTGRARIHYHNDRRNRFTLILPARLDPSDRRRDARILLDTAENVKATFRPDGMEFLEVTGRLSNLSESGFRMVVEGAVDTDDGRIVDPADVPFSENQRLESIAITGLRTLPVAAQGMVLEVDPEPIGPILGVRFRSMASEDRDFLRTCINERAQTQPAAFPPVEPVAMKEEKPLPAQLEEPVAKAQPSADDMRLRRFKTLALVMPPGAEREVLITFLVDQGFTRVLPAGTLAEMASMMRKSPPDALLVDWPDASTSELDIILFLGNHPFPAPPRIILACVHATTQLAREANRLGVTQLLVKPYTLDDALIDILQQQLLGDDD
jgi:CheY-like chemotaxis protein